jgi:hypothetical protein
VSEEAAEASSSSVSSVLVMTDVHTVLAVLFATETAAVIVVGMSMQLDSPSVFRHNDILDISKYTRMQEASQKKFAAVPEGRDASLTSGFLPTRAICPASRGHGRFGVGLSHLAALGAKFSGFPSGSSCCDRPTFPPIRHQCPIGSSSFALRIARASPSSKARSATSTPCIGHCQSQTKKPGRPSRVAPGATCGGQVHPCAMASGLPGSCSNGGSVSRSTPALSHQQMPRLPGRLRRQQRFARRERQLYRSSRVSLQSRRAIAPYGLGRTGRVNRC